MTNGKGFTLIELLIVVAIIAILAAIAIPNFLAAQVRSKVSRAKNDFRTIATAVESYFVDNNTYPIHADPANPNQNGVFGNDIYGSNRMDLMTSPVAYITSWPTDPFAVNNNNTSIGVGYFLYCWNTQTNTPFSNIFYAERWATNSPGPDQKYGGIPGSNVPWNSEVLVGDDSLTWARAYDPSNGTVSTGDLYRTSLSGQIN
jgi:prepilin-type N-terminal cleavage/methylation domain-containing protein